MRILQVQLKSSYIHTLLLVVHSLLSGHVEREAYYVIDCSDYFAKR